MCMILLCIKEAVAFFIFELELEVSFELLEVSFELLVKIGGSLMLNCSFLGLHRLFKCWSFCWSFLCHLNYFPSGLFLGLLTCFCAYWLAFMLGIKCYWKVVRIFFNVDGIGLIYIFLCLELNIIGRFFCLFNWWCYWAVYIRLLFKFVQN